MVRTVEYSMLNTVSVQYEAKRFVSVVFRYWEVQNSMDCYEML